MEEHGTNYKANNFVYSDFKAFKHLGKVFPRWKLTHISVRSSRICRAPPLLPNSLYLWAVDGQVAQSHIHLGHVFEGRKPF